MDAIVNDALLSLFYKIILAKSNQEFLTLRFESKKETSLYIKTDGNHWKLTVWSENMHKASEINLKKIILRKHLFPKTELKKKNIYISFA